MKKIILSLFAFWINIACGDNLSTVSIFNQQAYEKEVHFFWQASDLEKTPITSDEIVKALNLILTVEKQPDHIEQLKYFRAHPNLLISNADNLIRMRKKILFDDKPYILVNFSDGTAAGSLYIIADNKIYFHSDAVGNASAVDSVSFMGTKIPVILVYGNSSGTGTYEQDVFVLKLHGNQLDLIAVYPGEGYNANIFQPNQAVLIYSTKFLSINKSTIKLLLETSLDLRSLSSEDKRKIMMTCGFDQSLKKSFIVNLNWNKLKQQYIFVNQEKDVSNRNLLNIIMANS